MKVKTVYLALLLAAGVVRADVWIVPLPLAPDAGQQVTARLYAGDGAGEETVRPGGGYQHIWKQGRENLDAAAPDFVPSGAGVHLLTFASHASADARGDRVQEFAKALVVVGAPDPGSPLRWSEVGHRLEVVPQTDPVALLRGESRLELQVLYDREPLAGVRVEAFPLGDSSAARQARTDEIGVVSLLLDRAGRWLVRVTHRGRCESCDPPVMERLASTLVLAVR